MSLQRRLTLFFVLIVILPLAAAGVVVHRVVVGEFASRALLSLRPALDSAVTLYNGKVKILEPEVRSVMSNPTVAGHLIEGNRAGVERYLAQALMSTDTVDFLIVLDPGGNTVARARGPANFVAGIEEPSFDEIAGAGPGAGRGFTRTRAIPVRAGAGASVGRVIGGFWTDAELVSQPLQGDIQLSVAVGETVVASTAELDRPVTIDADLDEQFEADIAGAGTAEAASLQNDVALIASTPSAPVDAVSRRVLIPMLGVLVLALIGTTLLAFLLARLLTQPLEELAVGAQAIAEGRFDHQIPVRSSDEVGQLAVAYNDMRDRLSASYTQLSTSRDQLQRAIRRVGETLRSTHDMKQMLDSILNTAADAVGADAATLWMFTPTRDGMQATTSIGMANDPQGVISVGQGIVGFVAERAQPVLLPSAGGPRPTRPEPNFPVAIVVPLYSEDRIMAVLATYRRDETQVFNPEDLETVVFLAEQGGVAVENVLLHEEAQRLSLTDGLTGTGNRRYFQMQFRQVLATSARFERPFSVLMLDLDHFKALNDTHGHQRGDAILIEFAARVKKTLREVDTFARYGGEEFIGLLPETDEVGAVTTGEKIREAIRSQPFGSLGDDPVVVTVSIGVASYPKNGDSFHALVEGADRALYRAKQQGRDRVVAAPSSGQSLKVAR